MESIQSHGGKKKEVALSSPNCYCSHVIELKWAALTWGPAVVLCLLLCVLTGSCVPDPLGEYPPGQNIYNSKRSSSLSPCGHLHWWPTSHGGYAVGILAWIKVLVGATIFPSAYLQGNRRPASLGNTPDETVQVSVLLNLNSQLHFFTFCNGVGSVHELPWRTLSERRLEEKFCSGWLSHFTRSSLVMGKHDIETMSTGICRCFLQNKWIISLQGK